MSILFMGGELSSFIPANSNVGEETIAGAFNTSFCRCAVSSYYSADYCESGAITAGTDLYAHFDIAIGGYIASSASSLQRFVWLDNSSVAKVRMVYTGSTSLLGLEYYNGSAWVSVGTITVGLTSRQTIDIRAKVNSASGLLRLYIDGTLRIDSGTVDLSSIASLAKIRFYGGDVSSFGSNTWASQVIVADEPTIGMRLTTRYPSGAGSTSSWTGTYAEIDEIAHSDADFVNSGTINQVSTFAQTGPGVTGYTVRAVGVYARARCGASGPQNLQLAIRASGTDYFSASKLLDVGYTAVGNIWETNPATAAAFLNSAADTLQPGVKSIT